MDSNIDQCSAVEYTAPQPRLTKSPKKEEKSWYFFFCIGVSISIGGEIRCLPYAGFFFVKMVLHRNTLYYSGWLVVFLSTTFFHHVVHIQGSTTTLVTLHHSVDPPPQCWPHTTQLHFGSLTSDLTSDPSIRRTVAWITQQSQPVMSFVPVEQYKKTKKSSIRETKHLSIDADSSTDTTVRWSRNTPKPNFFEKRKNSSKIKKTQNL